MYSEKDPDCYKKNTKNKLLFGMVMFGAFSNSLTNNIDLMVEIS